MSVITVSRQYGSGGDEIVDQVCQLTGYHRFDKELIAMTAKDAGLSEPEISDFSEEDYQDKSFMDRLLGRSKQVGSLQVWKAHMDGSRFAIDMPVDEEHALSMVQKAIVGAYHGGDWVIVGRGGQIVLKDFQDVLHLRIEAPLEKRIQRIQTQQYLDRKQAQSLIAEKDAISSNYLKRFYGVDWADPSLYHFIINTDRMDHELVARYIAAMAGCLKPVAV